MAKKFVRGVTGVDDIESFDKTLTNVNDILSDGQDTYVHTKKGKTESYYKLTDSIKQVVSTDNMLNINKQDDTITISNTGLATKDDINNLATKDDIGTMVYEHLKQQNLLTSTYYKHDTITTDTVTDSNYVAFKPFDVKAGVTYHLWNCAPYFTKFKDTTDGTLTMLTEDNSRTTSSISFKPKNDGQLYVSLSKQSFEGGQFGISNGKKRWKTYDENHKYIKNGYEPQDYVITVSKDVSSDYTKLVNAVASIPDASDNQYTIYLNDGVYDLYQELGGDSWLGGISGNRNGLNLMNKNVKIIGLGRPTIKLFIPDNLATSSTVPNVSVIECSGSVELKNLIIEGKNVRYCIHDETGNYSTYNNTNHKYENILVKHNGNKSDTWISSAAIACGTSSGCIYSFNNSTLVGSNYPALSLHNNENQKGGTITIDGLKVSGTYTFDDGINTSIKFGYYKQNNASDIYQIIVKNLISDGNITVRPENSQVASTNIFNVTNFTGVTLNTK